MEKIAEIWKSLYDRTNQISDTLVDEADYHQYSESDIDFILTVAAESDDESLEKAVKDLSGLVLKTTLDSHGHLVHRWMSNRAMNTTLVHKHPTDLHAYATGKYKELLKHMSKKDAENRLRSHLKSNMGYYKSSPSDSNTNVDVLVSYAINHHNITKMPKRKKKSTITNNNISTIKKPLSPIEFGNKVRSITSSMESILSDLGDNHRGSVLHSHYRYIYNNIVSAVTDKISNDSSQDYSRMIAYNHIVQFYQGIKRRVKFFSGNEDIENPVDNVRNFLNKIGVPDVIESAALISSNNSAKNSVNIGVSDLYKTDNSNTVSHLSMSQNANIFWSLVCDKSIVRSKSLRSVESVKSPAIVKSAYYHEYRNFGGKKSSLIVIGLGTSKMDTYIHEWAHAIEWRNQDVSKSIVKLRNDIAKDMTGEVSLVANKKVYGDKSVTVYDLKTSRNYKDYIPNLYMMRSNSSDINDASRGSEFLSTFMGEYVKNPKNIVNNYGELFRKVLGILR